MTQDCGGKPRELKELYHRLFSIENFSGSINEISHFNYNGMIKTCSPCNMHRCWSMFLYLHIEPLADSLLLDPYNVANGCTQ